MSHNGSTCLIWFYRVICLVHTKGCPVFSDSFILAALSRLLVHAMQPKRSCTFVPSHPTVFMSLVGPQSALGATSSVRFWICLLILGHQVVYNEWHKFFAKWLEVLLANMKS